MPVEQPSFPIGGRIALPGHFDGPVVLEAIRPLGPDGSLGDECRVRPPDGRLDEAVISVEEAEAAPGRHRRPRPTSDPSMPSADAGSSSRLASAWPTGTTASSPL